MWSNCKNISNSTCMVLNLHDNFYICILYLDSTLSYSYIFIFQVNNKIVTQITMSSNLDSSHLYYNGPLKKKLRVTT